MADYKYKRRRVEVCNGVRCWKEYRWGAFRRVRFLWVFSFWWMVGECEWRTTLALAKEDAEADFWRSQQRNEDAYEKF